jgi:hypothetical protein
VANLAKLISKNKSGQTYKKLIKKSNMGRRNTSLDFGTPCAHDHARKALFISPKPCQVGTGYTVFHVLLL